MFRNFLIKLGYILIGQKERTKSYNEIATAVSRVERRVTWMALRPLIYDMERFRKNTWDQNKITEWQQYLTSFKEETNEGNQD